MKAGSGAVTPSGAKGTIFSLVPFAALRVTLVLLLAAACSGERDAGAPVRLETSPAGEHTLVTLIPAAHIKLNARRKPALELADGSVLRFDTPRLTADSAYFAEPPAREHRRVRGTLRASVCENDAPVCRALVMEL
jgi:hypothetical protein